MDPSAYSNASFAMNSASYLPNYNYGDDDIQSYGQPYEHSYEQPYTLPSQWPQYAPNGSDRLYPPQLQYDSFRPQGELLPAPCTSCTDSSLSSALLPAEVFPENAYVSSDTMQYSPLCGSHPHPGQYHDPSLTPYIAPESPYALAHHGYSQSSPAAPCHPSTMTGPSYACTNLSSHGTPSGPTEYAHKDNRTAAPPSPPSDSPSKTSPRLITHKRRNSPASPPQPSYSSSSSAPTSANRSSSSAPTSANRWACPHCDYVQLNHRSPDLKRHIQTHTADVTDWVCCGVPQMDARDLKLPPSVIQEEPFYFEGMPMVGGCRRTFSRRDALIRHLKAQERLCYGNAWSLYQPGNRKESGRS